MPSLVAAQHARERITRSVAHLLTTRADILLLPTLAITAPPIGATTVDLCGSPVSVGLTMASFTLLQNLTRLPAVAVPCGLAPDGLPTSVQLTASASREDVALAVAHALECALWPESARWPGDRSDAR